MYMHELIVFFSALDTTRLKHSTGERDSAGYAVLKLNSYEPDPDTVFRPADTIWILIVLRRNNITWLESRL